MSLRTLRDGGGTLLGMPVGDVVAPADILEAAEIVRERHARGATVAPLGGGTALGFGHPPERVDTVLCTERLARVVEYEPADLIVTVEAGMTFDELQHVLGGEGQRLALDPPFPELATVGGALATDAYGPRRARYGTLRDLIVGISFVRADGELVRGGGKVVKNVAGFDLPKLLVGSLGTLGLIATATFRLHPQPEAMRRLRLAPLDATRLAAVLSALDERRLEPAALSAERGVGGYVLDVLFEGFAVGVDEQAAAVEMIADRLGVACGTSPHDDAAARRRDGEARGFGSVRARLSFAPASFAQLDREAIAPLAGAFANVRVLAYPTLATVFVGGDGALETVAPALAEARRAVEATGGTLVLTHVADALLASRVDRFGTLPASFEIMRRLKARFDPQRTFNPGRFLGGL